jgi:hypothetical protein
MTTVQYQTQLDREGGPIDKIDTAIWSGDMFHNYENINAFRRMMSRWEAGLKIAEGVVRGADELARNIDKEVIATTIAGANIHAGDGGYSIGTKENYDVFVKARNYPIPGTK